MLVYRYLEKTELEHIMNGEIDKIGKRFTKKMSNTFTYNKNINYLHFFKDLNSMDYIRKIDFKLSGEFYFCTFDIPSSALIAGFGEYHNDNYKGIIQLEEFILEAKMLKPEWLIKAKLDSSREDAKKQEVGNFTRFLKNTIKKGKILTSEKEFLDICTDSTIE